MSSKKNKTDTGGRKPRFPELPPKYSSSRELRNKAEKMRRDRLNKLIEEMRSLVPIICNKTKKSDTTRSNILRLTANFLRVQRLFPQNSTNTSLVPMQSQPSLLGEGIPHLESMEGFFFLLADDGRILFVSENVDKFVGYTQIDLMGHPIYDFAHPADLTKLKTTIAGKRAVSSNSYNTEEPEEEEERRQSFYVRLKEKPLAKNDTIQYEHLHVVGRVRKAEGVNKGGLLGLHTFVGVMRPVRDRPITELNLVESVQDQYITRHLPDGRIIYADHRISTISGYLPSEVQGKSAFNFFNPEDLPWTTMAMRHMFASSNGEGSTVYRLVTQTGMYICLQTKGYLEFNKTTNKIESFLCINTVIRPGDEEKYLNEQKEKFSPFITEVQINAMTDSKPYGITFSPPSSSSTSACISEPVKPAVASIDLFCSSAEASVISGPTNFTQSNISPAVPISSLSPVPSHPNLSPVHLQPNISPIPPHPSLSPNPPQPSLSPVPQGTSFPPVSPILHIGSHKPPSLSPPISISTIISPSSSLSSGPSFQSLKRPLSPEPTIVYKRPTIHPIELPAMVKVSNKRPYEEDSIPQPNKSMRNIQYSSRVEPIYRIEGGHRVMDIEDNFPQFQSVNENSNLTGISQDMTQLIEKQNDLMRQHLMVPSIQALNTDEVNHGLDLLPTPSIQRVDSVIRALPPKQVEDDRQDSRLQEIPNCQDREDLIAEKLKLKLNLLAPRSNTQTFTKMEQDLFSLIKQDEVLLSMEEAENSIDSLIRDIHTDTASTPTS